MERHELQELHYITPIENVPSMIQNGLLSHNGAKKLPHESVAMEEIQDRRRPKVVPGGLPLHDYVNLYINARNKMMYSRKDQHLELCVLRIDTRVLDIQQTIVSDRNASSDWARFYPSPDGLAHIVRDEVFASYWVHDDDPIETMRHSSVVCAEVLVPHRVDPGYIFGAYVSCEEARQALVGLQVGIDIQLKPHLFFR